MKFLLDNGLIKRVAKCPLWTTVIHFYAALQTTCFNVCSRCKMLQLGSSQASSVVTTSLPSWDNFTGCQWDSMST